LLASFITSGLVLTIAAIIALQGYLWRRFFSHNNANTLLLAFPVIWILFECLRSYLFTGFPWLFLGYSQTNSFLSNFAPIGSVYLVSFTVALSAGLIMHALVKRQYAIYSIAGLLLLWGVAGALNKVKWTAKEHTPLQVALIQSNVPQSFKWDPEQAADTLTLYKSYTNQQWDKQIIVWSEGAIPIFLDQAQAYIAYFDKLGKQKNVALIAGVATQEETKYFNTMIGIGAATGSYQKRHLVPFGEYVPLGNLLRGIIGLFDLPMSNFSFFQRQTGITMFGFSIGSYICYEVAYLDEFLTQFPAAKLIITISNDAWFGNSFAPAQQLQIAQLRSIETGRYQLFSTDNGITAVIDPAGRIIDKLPQFQTAV
jgi:apolipoprotein N-acyltransferase